MIQLFAKFKADLDKASPKVCIYGPPRVGGGHCGAPPRPLFPDTCTGGKGAVHLRTPPRASADPHAPQGWTPLSYARAKGKYGATEEAGIYPEVRRGGVAFILGWAGVTLVGGWARLRH